MNGKTPFYKRGLAGAAVLALGTMGALGVASSASALPGPDQPSSPDFGSLTIHKLAGSQGQAGTGVELTNVAGDPLEDVEFTIWQLGIDDGGNCVPFKLDEADAWENVPTGTAPATLAEVQADYCLYGAPMVGTTDENGELPFSGLDLGVYYVQETDASNAKLNGEAVNVTSEVAPFYVSIPLPNEGDWIYDVHAYPKNQLTDEPSKTINEDEDQNGYAVGDTVEWTITQTVPALNAGEEYTSATIWDYLPSSLAFHETVSVTLNGTPFTDYTVDENVVSWTLTQNGLDAIEAGDVIEIVFTTTVTEVPENGTIENPGSIDPGAPGYGSEFNGNQIPGGPTPYTYWGELIVNKVDQDGEPLAGAEFQVFPKTDATCAANVPAGDPVATGTSGSDGVVIWTPPTSGSASLGLWVANSPDGPLTNPSREYCLYETVVPAGYSASPVNAVTITPGSGVNAVTYDIENVQNDGPTLPLTGGQGQILMIIAGLLLVAVGGTLYAVRRRQQAEV